MVYEAGGEFTLCEVEFDELRTDEILVEIEASGVCFTDVEGKRLLSPPAVLGHEGTGTVVEIGNQVRSVKTGDRVILSYPSCGRCPSCDANLPYLCDYDMPLCFDGCRSDGSKPVLLDGESISSAFFQQSSFATHAVSNERNAVVISGIYDPSLLAAVPCGVQTGAGSVLNAFNVQADEGLVVYGTGVVGLSAIMAGTLVGASPLIAVDINESRLGLAREFGATHVVNAAKENAAERIKKWAPRGVPYVLDTSGTLQAFEAGIDNLCMGGTLGYVTPPSGGEHLSFSFEKPMMRAANLRGIIQGSSVPQQFLPRLLELQREGRFPFDRLIRTYAFEEINQAFADAKSGETVKPVLLMK